MFGNLVEVRSPALIARYNRALKHLTGKETKLSEFHVDISGYSPEIGDELGDILYLNPNGCNRQFILLTTDQKTAPLLNAQFSSSRSILRNFITTNEKQLFALTAREAVAGELMNSVFNVDHPRDLLKIQHIEVEADTVQSHVADGQKLQKMLDTFNTQQDAWWDDVLIADMIETAKIAGDINRNPINLEQREYAQTNYHTQHFGGVYIFRDLENPTMIASQISDQFDDLPIDHVIDINNRNDVAKFLTQNELVEPIVNAKSMDVAAVLLQKIDFIVINVLAQKLPSISNITRRDIRRLIQQYGDEMPAEFDGLMDLYRWSAAGGKWPHITSDHPAFFYTLRATNHGDKDLVNALLAQLTPMDFRTLFICHKELFYAAYRNWPDAKKNYVVQFLEAEYQMDKEGAREALFGNEPEMKEDDADADDIETIIRRVGPWGAVRNMK
ncbi:hypothetical protein GCM10008927_05380 [Amylibacter ulvae]|uniref:Uncharacterized protein n=2 Tax=Paramylibacter ulvae TaxID=1651968 RepID=A0ABQ3CTU1_9RHOB|nr:hypothetical protein GCM10008927_05380 [Amylibacter ulvae]